LSSLFTFIVASLLAISLTMGMSQAWAADAAPGIVGKDDWLFYRYEMTDAADLPSTEQTIALIAKFNRVLARNGVSLVVTMVPLKARVYAEHLPADIKLNPYMFGNYQRMSQALRNAHVNVLELNEVFMESAAKNAEAQLYFRLDTHWAPAGAMLAAETMRIQMMQDNKLQPLLAAIPAAKYENMWGKKKVKTKSRDLVEQLPAGAATYPAEFIRLFSVTRADESDAGLLGAANDPQITLLGSSYSMAWTGFADALRYTLQRDILDVAVGADRGSWTGMESYLRDDAFQTQRPKLLIWEMPERDMRAPPDYHYRDARYQSDNTEWLLRAAAWVEKDCKPAKNALHMNVLGLVKTAADKLKVGATSSTDFIELTLDQALTSAEYISINISNAGSKELHLEVGEGANKRKFSLPLAGDGMNHLLKMPLLSKGGGYDKLRIYPGINSSFAIGDLKVCRQPEDLLR
jgi:alginate O-acetyltransferase complex protein AlgJ